MIGNKTYLFVRLFALMPMLVCHENGSNSICSIERFSEDWPLVMLGEEALV